jgi:hypothetical protein
MRANVDRVGPSSNARGNCSLDISQADFRANFVQGYPAGVLTGPRSRTAGRAKCPVTEVFGRIGFLFFDFVS